MSAQTKETEFIIQHSLLNTKILKKIEGQLNMHGISFTEYMILHHLNQSPDKTLRRIELADCISTTTSGVTRVLAPMEKIKLISKNQTQEMQESV